MKDLHYLFWKTSRVNGVSLMQKNFSLLKIKIIKVTNENNQEVDNGLHIQRVLQDLVNGMLM